MLCQNLFHISLIDLLLWFECKLSLLDHEFEYLSPMWSFCFGTVWEFLGGRDITGGSESLEEDFEAL